MTGDGDEIPVVHVVEADSAEGARAAALARELVAARSEMDRSGWAAALGAARDVAAADDPSVFTLTLLAAVTWASVVALQGGAAMGRARTDAGYPRTVTWPPRVGPCSGCSPRKGSPCSSAAVARVRGFGLGGGHAGGVLMVVSPSPEPHPLTLILAAYAALVSTGALAWQVYVWRDRRKTERRALEVEGELLITSLMSAGGTTDALKITVANRSASPVTVTAVGGQWGKDQAPWPITPTDPPDALPRLLPAGESMTVMYARTMARPGGPDKIGRVPRPDDPFKHSSGSPVIFWAQIDTGERFRSTPKTFKRSSDELV